MKGCIQGSIRFIVKFPMKSSASSNHTLAAGLLMLRVAWGRSTAQHSPGGRCYEEIIGVRKALLFLGLCFLVSPSATPTDERLAKLRFEADRPSAGASKNKGNNYKSTTVQKGLA